MVRSALLLLGLMFLTFAACGTDEPNGPLLNHTGAPSKSCAKSNEPSPELVEEKASVADHRIAAPDDWRSLDDEKLAWLVIKEIWQWADFYGYYASFRDQLAELTAGQRAVYATAWLDSEVKNGGFYQFFQNGTGMLGPEALEGFALIGMDDSAEKVRDAFEFYKMEPYPRERDERTARLPNYDSTKDKRREIDKAYYESTYDKTSGKKRDSILERKQAAYIRAHPDEFFVL
ncbi:MAG: DMP19 family protein [Planctomycetes bacterium]|nr:DMP19 family protein [Planctomycetota bacterium]